MAGAYIEIQPLLSINAQPYWHRFQNIVERTKTLPPHRLLQTQSAGLPAGRPDRSGAAPPGKTVHESIRYAWAMVLANPRDLLGGQFQRIEGGGEIGFFDLLIIRGELSVVSDELAFGLHEDLGIGL